MWKGRPQEATRAKQELWEDTTHHDQRKEREGGGCRAFHTTGLPGGDPL